MMMSSLTLGATTSSAATKLPACPVVSKWPVKTVSPGVVAALKSYYGSRHLTPIKIVKNQEMVLNVTAESVGTHYCLNPDGSKSGYVGVVPRNAIAAVMVRVTHKPYPVTQSANTFATLADVATKGWRVVSDDTAP